MKLEDIKVGQYVRTKFGIKQIYEIDEHKAKWKYLYKLKKQEGDGCVDLGVLSKEDIIKASFNIIDILEVGDYVNGSKIANIVKEDGIQYLVLDRDEVYYDNCLEPSSDKDIKSIITHEQMEQMSYRLGE